MRDKIKTPTYWRKVINEDNQRVLKFRNKLNNNEVKEDRIQAVIEGMDRIKFSLFKSMYSAGYDINECKVIYLEMLKSMSVYWQEDRSYVDLLWLLSIGILLRIKSEYVDYLREMIHRHKVCDKLINFMMHYLDKDWQTDGDYFMKSPYQFLDDVINTDKENAVKLLKDYLTNNWYKTHYEMAWFDSDKLKNDTYSGYWSFESGAIVKILGLDDSELKDVPYYPYDLVHYK